MPKSNVALRGYSLYIAMNFLLITTPKDKKYIDAFRAIFPADSNIRIITALPETTKFLEVEDLCMRHKIEVIITCDVSFLKKALLQTPDFLDTKVSLDSHFGNFFKAGRIHILPVNPLEQIYTTDDYKFLVKRFITKATNPEKWLPKFAFSFQVFNPSDLDYWLNEFNNSSLCAIDIETYRNDPDRKIKLVGYAILTKNEGIKIVSVPLKSLTDLYVIRQFNNTKVPKVMQNGHYDNSYFLRWNAPVYNYLFDTYNMMHSWYVELPRSLAFISSFCIREIRYWKDDGKHDELTYNARDVWTTLISCLAILNEWPDWARQNYLIQFPYFFPSFHCGLEGIAVDMDILRKRREEKEIELEKSLVSIRTMLGLKDFNPNSPKQMLELFKILGCGDLESTGEAERAIAESRNPLNERILGEITKFKKTSKLLSTYYVEEKFWHNRCLYKIDCAKTDTARSASTESDFWCGLQIQNIPRGKAVKSFLKADDGYFLFEADKSQAEARCVAYLSGETKLIDLVESSKDYHSWNAQEFFGIPYDQIYNEATGEKLNEELRDLSKRTNHGANYNMGANVMLQTMGIKNVTKAKTTLKLPKLMPLKSVCQFLLDRYSSTYPKVKNLWYSTLTREIVTTSKLKSPLGWTRYFFGSPAENKSKLNAAVAHGPQNLNVALLNKSFYKIWWKSIYGEYKGKLRLKAQIHDSIFGQVKLGEESILKYILEDMKEPVEIKGSDGVKRVMVIPTDLSVGKGDKKYKSIHWSDLK